MAKKSALTKDEKRLLYYVSASVIITLAVVLWLQSLAIDPVVTIPSPKRPNPNAYDYYLKATKFFVSCPVQTSHGADTFDYNDLDGIDFYHGFVHGKNRQLWKPTLAQLLKLQQLNMPAFATLRQGFKYQYSSVSLVISMTMQSIRTRMPQNYICCLANWLSMPTSGVRAAIGTGQ